MAVVVVSVPMVARREYFRMEDVLVLEEEEEESWLTLLLGLEALVVLKLLRRRRSVLVPREAEACIEHLSIVLDNMLDYNLFDWLIV